MARRVTSLSLGAVDLRAIDILALGLVLVTVANAGHRLVVRRSPWLATAGLWRWLWAVPGGLAALVLIDLIDAAALQWSAGVLAIVAQLAAIVMRSGREPPAAAVAPAPLDDVTRRNMRETWLEILHGFCSPRLQRLWVTPIEGIVVSFEESMSGWFDDLSLGDGLAAAVTAGWMTQAEADACATFHAAAAAYRAPGNDAQVLADPLWANVVSQARTSWMRLHELVAADERRLMRSLEERWGRIE